jgi:hypothetical protein
MREWRVTNPQTPEQRMKQIARAYAGVYLRRGKIQKVNECQFCGDAGTQMHHEDYSEPLQIIWLCKDCHQSLHAFDLM